MRGYFRNADATLAAVHDGWMDSGDLGYRVDGELFITGREKDLIVQGGRNICAEEVEAITSSVPGIRPNCVDAFGIPDHRNRTRRRRRRNTGAGPGSTRPARARGAESPGRWYRKPPRYSTDCAAAHSAQDIERKDPEKCDA
jgi:acyl-CoA synthetase (AMP-forming)/AMP-acid ligase II